MYEADRRLFPRYSLRIPVRFRVADFSLDMAEHSSEAVNVSRYGLFMVTQSPLRVGASLNLTVRVPVEISGMAMQESRCKGQIVHECVMKDGRLGYGVRIERTPPPHQRAEQASGELSVGSH